MYRLASIVAFVAVSVASAAAAQNPPPIPQKYRDADVLTLRAAAKAEDAEAMLWLGFRYHEGHNVPKDEVQAVAWFRRAADLGQSSGMFFLGVAYWSGRGVKQDFVEAYKWLDLGTRHGDDSERRRSAGARNSLARVLSSQMILQAKNLEADWEAAFKKRR